MLYAIILILIFVILFMWEEDQPIKISKYSRVINHDVTLAIFEAMKRIEEREDEDIQYLINQGKVTKDIIEQDADKIMFQRGEFPAEMTCLDGRDFAKLVVVYQENVRGASQDQISWMLNSIYN
tara:strand:+ start:4283 stop:4654 length:372 start_codon:yes stop_codon:yes gene_type:complete